MPDRGSEGTAKPVHRLGIGWGLVLALVCLPAGAGRLYKWVDEQGHVHYGDHVPARYAGKTRTELNDQALEVRRIQGAKTPEELAAERRRAARRREEERRKAAQLAHDRMLLSTFGSVDDMIMARDGKIAALDSLIRVTRTRIAKLREKLDLFLRRAATLERAGRPVPARLTRNIHDAREQIRRYQAFIREKQAEQQRIRETFEKDIARFRELRAMAAQGSGAR
ncbi:MAG: DUF4124 domain-containing protein [Gammaproteobacteria bacterium]|nr:MAG: DUF4124 domain-containing protein [Gammaproteobacteria bacterium]